MNRYTVALSGLADADVDAVRSALERAELADWNLGEAPDADVVIVDVDSVWGHMDWLKATASGRPTIAYSDQPPADPAEASLAKPLQPESLAHVLSGLSQGLPGQDPASARPAETTELPAATPAAEPARTVTVVGTDTDSEAGADSAASAATEPEPAPQPVVDETPEPEPAPDTVGAWLLAGLAHQPFALGSASGERLLVDPEKQVYHGPAVLKPLIPLLQRSPDAIESPSMGELATLTGAEQPLSRLLWLAALIQSPGRVAGDADAATEFRLDRWPQIEREFPRHFRIATAMMKQPGSLGELASSANTPEADVADFINAYTAIGFVSSNQADDVQDDERRGRPLLRNPFARNASR